MGWGDEQDRFGCFPSSNRTEKVPPAGGGVAPCKQSPRIMIYYAPIAKAIRQSRTSPPGVPLAAVPLPSSALLCRLWRFRALHWPNRARKQSHTHNEKASQKGKQTSKQAQARELASMLAILIQAKQITPLYILYSEKHINRQAREKRKAILFPSMPIYRIAIYYNKAI